jgi:hypothetical protein
MNSNLPPDNLETRLRRQAFRHVPAEWRAEILAASEPAAPGRAPAEPRPASGWRAWLWPCPQAWAGMAAIWVIGLALQNSGGAARVLSTNQAAALNSAPVMSFPEQQRWLAQLLGPTNAAGSPPVEPPRRYVPGPRSGRQSASVVV